VAPIALYPDPLLAQTLAASTYPLELIQLQQWLEKNKNLKDKALADAVAKQPWDPSIQSMAAVPEAVKRLADDIQWTTQLGDAFLDQQSEVMDAVQRMRKKADEKGALKSNEQQTVETKVIEEKTVIVVQPTNPEVVYVPSYNPTVVYPPPVYPTRRSITPPTTRAPGWSLLVWVWRWARRSGAAPAAVAAGAGTTPSTSTTTTTSTEPNTNVNRGRVRQRRWRQLAAQLPASRRGPLLEQGDGEQIRRVGQRGRASGPAAACQPAELARRRGGCSSRGAPGRASAGASSRVRRGGQRGRRAAVAAPSGPSATARPR
jgi:hypothetical protein